MIRTRTKTKTKTNGTVTVMRHRDKKNIINSAIRSMLSQGVEKFNLKSINDLLTSGSKLCVQGEHNVLAVIIDEYTNYVTKNNHIVAKHNIINLLNFLISKGAIMDSNTMIRVLRTNDIDLIRRIHVGTNQKSWHLFLDKVIGLSDSHGVKMICDSGIEPNLLHLAHAIETCNQEIIEIVGKFINSNSNVLEHAIRIGDHRLVKFLCDRGIKLNQSQNDESNSLSQAVKTKNLLIVKILCEYGANPDISMTGNNTLYKAVKTMDPEIIFLVIQRGGIPTYGNINIFSEVRYLAYNYDDVKINRIVNLLMCCAAAFVHISSNDSKNFFFNRKLDKCFQFLNHKGNEDEIKELRKELVDTMNQIMAKQQHMDKIDSATQRIIPIPCLEIIYEYAQLVKFIDWANY